MLISRKAYYRFCTLTICYNIFILGKRPRIAVVSRQKKLNDGRLEHGESRIQLKSCTRERKKLKCKINTAKKPTTIDYFRNNNLRSKEKV